MELKSKIIFALKLIFYVNIVNKCTCIRIKSNIFGSNLLSSSSSKLLSESRKSGGDSPDGNHGIESVLGSILHKPSLEALNTEIKQTIQKESYNSNLGLCSFTENPYIDLGFRDTNYDKCTKYLLSQETWLGEDQINNEMFQIMSKGGLTIPSKQKLKIPELSVIFKETFSQICVNFFISLLNTGALFLNGTPCTGYNCHDIFNSVCSDLTEKYGKSAFVLGASCVAETIKKICQESRRQLAAKYKTLIASPADITPDNKALEVIEPIPT
ncbi:hypothetical protein FG386_002618 [Cryptosporidium ryanae]|uniref:uncharacterized protein n=1 Tax=Cryptosporidium ryanae TaxID=515981 RepID=UPI00351A1EF6|nr:hypothetical protein FG386_002618 [Cryptosporidium ryanae]